MNARWIILVYIIQIHLKSITTQHHYPHHHHYYDDTIRQYDDDDPDEYEELSSEYNTRRRAKHRKDLEECYCTCDACFTREGPKPCCNEFCRYCHVEPAIPNQDPYANPERKVVFVPFPYPLIVPNAQNDAATENKTSTEKPQPDATRSSVTISSDNEESTKPANSTKTQLRSKIVEVDMLSKHRQLKQLNPAVKRTRPAWVPKYGIVPIPDNLAAKLMTQLTEVRALKAKRL